MKAIRQGVAKLTGHSLSNVDCLIHIDISGNILTIDNVVEDFDLDFQ